MTKDLITHTHTCWDIRTPRNSDASSKYTLLRSHSHTPTMIYGGQAVVAVASVFHPVGSLLFANNKSTPKPTRTHSTVNIHHNNSSETSLRQSLAVFSSEFLSYNLDAWRSLSAPCCPSCCFLFQIITNCLHPSLYPSTRTSLFFATKDGLNTTTTALIWNQNAINVLRLLLRFRCSAAASNS